MPDTQKRVPSGVFVHELTDSDYRRARRAEKSVGRIREEYESERARWAQPEQRRAKPMPKGSLAP